MKEVVAGLIAKEIGLDDENVLEMLEVPPRLDMGDFAFPCFGLAKVEKKSPLEIAKSLASKIKFDGRVEAVGPYVNFFVDRVEFSKRVLENSGSKEKRTRKKKVCIDMSSPNIAKPFGVGHLRSTIIGNSIAEICKAVGAEPIKINYLGDWGTQFGKIIFGWKKWGDEKKLSEDPIGHLQELYVKVNASDEFDEDCRLEFKKLEDGDKENLQLWQRFREVSLKKFEELYEILGVEFDVVSGESLYNGKMDAVVEELRKKGLLVEDEGAEIVDLEDEGLGKVLIRKSDGATLYATRDLAAAIDRKKTYDFSRAVYEVGVEQKLHFKQFFAVLKRLGYSWADNMVHVAHGLYLDKDGKKFSTRRGKTVYMEDILNEVIEKAEKNLRDRGVSGDDLRERARKIAIAAIFYGDLKNYREHNMVFDIDRFLEFEGDTGPYLLYSYARASTLLRKVKVKVRSKKWEVESVDDVEFKLVKKLGEFDGVVKKAYEDFAPNLIANYCGELARDFNEFYHACPVLGGEKEGFRLEVVGKFRDVLGKGLELLGIEKLEEM